MTGPRNSAEKINPACGIDVAYVARLARLQLNADELATLQGQLEQIVEFVRKIRELDLSGVPPTSHARVTPNVFRADEVRPGLDSETTLANAPAHAYGQFAVPKIVE
ncbi:MAG: Asp-tRNA(Asn)/Glu-tRNA(Gln) amidotransferase subunit GatC [Verrucomicrobiota bacterium]|nr:Asp-tRNA(Asn)/Glu-tRNA(Gln) amidotransferase subunit GatC [Verrucomicrobiota bacterium]